MLNQEELEIICESARKAVAKALSKNNNQARALLKQEKMPSVKTLMQRAKLHRDKNNEFVMKAIVEDCLNYMDLDEEEFDLILESTLRK